MTGLILFKSDRVNNGVRQQAPVDWGTGKQREKIGRIEPRISGTFLHT
jgi:hypothetical protein